MKYKIKDIPVEEDSRFVRPIRKDEPDTRTEEEKHIDTFIDSLSSEKPLACHVLVFLAKQARPFGISEILSALKKEIRPLNSQTLQSYLDHLVGKKVVTKTPTSIGPCYWANKDIEPSYIQALARSLNR